jgi:hypothetical protein
MERGHCHRSAMPSRPHRLEVNYKGREVVTCKESCAADHRRGVGRHGRADAPPNAGSVYAADVAEVRREGSGLLGVTDGVL